MVRTVDVIHKKRRGLTLRRDEIQEIVNGFVSGDIPDYQMSALLMAICFAGMDEQETVNLTMAMAESGQFLDWSDIPGVKVDKHSTGGVGDTTSLVLAPLVAAAGLPVVKMSGRGLGHTGGTIDKLESIPGFRTSLSMDEFKSQVRSIQVAIAAQSADLAPADKKLYALRDVTSTVASLPLIASSIMSKKLASGADAIVIDVKVGDGAFMKTVEDARKLAETMVKIGKGTNRDVAAVLTRMDEPLGFAIGNALEVREAIATLRGEGPPDLQELCLTLGGHMLALARVSKDVADGVETLRGLLQSGAALQKFRDWIAAQGGDPQVVDNPDLLPTAPIVLSFASATPGVVLRMHAERLGLVAMRLGAGRATHADVIRPAVGLVLRKKVGEPVAPGETVVEVHAATEEAAARAVEELRDCIEIGDGSPFHPDFFLGTISQNDVAGWDAGKSVDNATTGLADPFEKGEGASSAHPATRLAGASAAGAGSSLLERAREARNQSYSPYSKFAVGAALLLSNGRVVTGANVENASYGLTSCAERNAVFHAISAGYLKGDIHIEEVAVVADSPEPVAPCGACRQVLAEFCSRDTPVHLGNLRGQVKETSLEKLLPYAFTDEQMV